MKTVFEYCLIALLLASCHTVEEVVDISEDVIGPPDRIAMGRATSHVYSADRDDSSEVRIDYRYYTPQFSSGVMDSVFKDSVNAIIVDAVQMETFTDDKGTPPLMLTDYFFETRAEVFASEAQEEIDYLESTPWSLEMTISIDESATSYVALDVSAWSYTGGAHGNGYSVFYLIDRETGKVLGLKDFFSDLDALNTIAEAFFREMEGLEPDASLEDAGYYFEEGIFSVNDNFYFAESAVIFYFNTYEIGPYAGGPTELKIPLSALSEVYVPRDRKNKK